MTSCKRVPKSPPIHRRSLGNFTLMWVQYPLDRPPDFDDIWRTSFLNQDLIFHLANMAKFLHAHQQFNGLLIKPFKPLKFIIRSHNSCIGMVFAARDYEPMPNSEIVTKSHNRCNRR